jgi:endonuclease/exonuclease/phosphatase family metal-dependent hydrolase
MALSAWAETRFTVVTYNVENYHLRAFGNRQPKAPAARAQVVAQLAAIKPDVVAVQEMGEVAALRELQAALKQAGMDLPHLEHVTGWDTNIFVGVLSRFPVVARNHHTNDSFLLNGRRFYASRGVAEVELKVTADYRFTLLTTHLKSKRQVAQADEAELREQEANLLRRHVDALLANNPQANVLVCGDFNDTKDARSTRALLGRGANALFDTRPAERNGDTVPAERANWDPRHVTWTHFYGKEDSYSRLDYILLSRGMAKEWRREGSYVFSAPNWGLASDHRPVVAEFVAENR